MSAYVVGQARDGPGPTPQRGRERLWCRQLTGRTEEQRKAQTKAAREAHKQYSTQRAIADPAVLGRMARICREAIRVGALTPDLALPAGDADQGAR